MTGTAEPQILLAQLAENVVVLLNAVALAIILIGTIEIFPRSTRAIVRCSEIGHELRSATIRRSQTSRRCSA
jgi:hypothetical protein